MGGSSKYFLEMRAGENQIQLDESKKATSLRGTNNAKEIIENQEQDLYRIFGQSKRMEEFLTAFNKELRNGILDELADEKYESNGMEFSTKNGASRLNYSEDDKWSGLKQALTDRESLLKLAEKSKEVIFDADGVEVPKVSRSHSGMQLNVKF